MVGQVSLQGQQTDPQPTGECTLYMTCILMCLVVTELDPFLVLRHGYVYVYVPCLSIVLFLF